MRLSDGSYEFLEIPAKEISHHVSLSFHLSDFHCLEVCHMHIHLANELKNQNHHFEATNTCKYLLASTLTLVFLFCTKEREKDIFSVGENGNNSLGICGLIA